MHYSLYPSKISLTYNLLVALLVLTGPSQIQGPVILVSIGKKKVGGSPYPQINGDGSPQSDLHSQLAISRVGSQVNAVPASPHSCLYLRGCCTPISSSVALTTLLYTGSKLT